VAATTYAVQSGSWFLDDEPITSVDLDEFGHHDVANNLQTLVKRTSSARAFIGLFGPFGVGKSTVIELLRADLDGSGFRILRVSAERHEKPGFHRSFVFAFAEALQHAYPRLKDEIEDGLASLQFSSSASYLDATLSPASRLVRSIFGSTAKRATRTAAAWIGVGALVILLLAVLLGLMGVDVLGSIGTWVAASLGILGLTGTAAVVNAFKAVGNSATSLLAPGTTTKIKPKVEAADEHERVFAALAGLVNERLVIAVDDIDRLGVGEVLEALNAIRSFQLTCSLNQPVFIVSVDEKIVAAAIERAEPRLDPAPHRREDAARAFMDRLFTQRQYMPLHAEGDLRAYALARLSEPTHVANSELGDELDRVVQVLIHDRVTNPRHVIRIVNGFFSDLRLAKRREEREGRRSIARGEVTRHPLVLARLAVLKVDFAAVYEAIVANTDLLTAIERDVEGGDQASAVLRLIDIVGETEYARARSYISRTAGATEPVEDLLPFLYLGQDDIDRSLGSARARTARSLLANGLVADFREFVADMGDEDEETLGRFGELIRGLTMSLTGIELDNALAVLTATSIALPTAMKPVVAEAVAAGSKRAQAPSYSPAGVTHLLAHAEMSHMGDTLYGILISPPAQLDVDDWFREVLKLRSELPDPARVTGALREQIKAAGDAGQIGTLDDIAVELALPENMDLADVAFAAIVTAAVESAEDLSDELASALRATKGSAKLGEYTEQVRALVRKNPGSLASRTLLEALERGPSGDAKTLAIFALNYIEDVVSDDEIVADLDAPALVAAAGLLTQAVVEASNYGRTVSKVRRNLDEECVKLHALATAELGYVAGFTTELFGALVEHAPEKVSPAVAALLSAWSGDEGSDELLEPLLPKISVLAESDRGPIAATLGEALASPTRHAAAMKAVSPLLVDDGGRSLLDQLTRESLIPQLTRRGNLNELTGAIEAISNGESLEPSTEVQLLSAIESGLLPYGGAITSVGAALLAAVRWTSPQLERALSLLTAQIGLLSDQDWDHLLRRAAASETIPSQLTDGLEEAAIRAIARGNSRDADTVMSVFARVSLPVDLLTIRHFGKTTIPTLSAAVDNEYDLSSLLSAELGDSTASESWQEVCLVCSEASPTGVGEFALAAVNERIANQAGPIEGAAWHPLLNVLVPDARAQAVDKITAGWAGSAAESAAASGVVEQVATLPEWDAALAPHVEAATRRWIHAEPSVMASRRLASATKSGPHMAEAARAVLGNRKRGPQKGPQRDAFAAAQEEFLRR